MIRSNTSKNIVLSLLALASASLAGGCVDDGTGYVDTTPNPARAEIDIVNNTDTLDLYVTIDGAVQDIAYAGEARSYSVTPGTHTVLLEDAYTGAIVYNEYVTALAGIPVAVTIDPELIDPIIGIENNAFEPEYCLIADVDGQAALDFSIENPSIYADPGHICGGEVGYISLTPNFSSVFPNYHTVSIYDEYTSEEIQTVTQDFPFGTLTMFAVDWF